MSPLNPLGQLLIPCLLHTWQGGVWWLDLEECWVPHGPHHLSGPGTKAGIHLWQKQPDALLLSLPLSSELLHPVEHCFLGLTKGKKDQCLTEIWEVSIPSEAADLIFSKVLPLLPFSCKEAFLFLERTYFTLCTSSTLALWQPRSNLKSKIPLQL